MGWFSTFINSSIGKKFVMAGTGIFLMLFLIVHLIGNLQLLKEDNGVAFNTYGYMMTHFVPIKIVSYSLYAFILWHTFQGLSLWSANRAARGNVRYAVNYSRGNESSARNMAVLGILIFVFIILHLWQFWLKMKMGVLPPVNVPAYEDHPVADLYQPVKEAYSSLFYVVFYVVCMGVLALHLWHGFWSAFQTFGISHVKWSPLIKLVGKAYSILIPLGFAIIPIYFYLFLR